MRTAEAHLKLVPSRPFSGLDFNIEAHNNNLMMQNNVKSGHCLFLSFKSLSIELWKRTEISIAENGDTERNSRMTRRRLDTVNIYSAIQVPELDLDVDNNDMGKLLTVDKSSLSDSMQDEMKYMASPRKGKGGSSAPTSGFGTDLDFSPFYTVSTTYPWQRCNPIDKIKYDKRLLVDGVRLIWSPVRRISMFAWSDAFKIKTFEMDSTLRLTEPNRLPDDSSTSLYKDGSGSTSQILLFKPSRNSSSEDLTEFGTMDNLSIANASVERGLSVPLHVANHRTKRSYCCLGDGTVGQRTR